MLATFWTIDCAIDISNEGSSNTLHILQYSSGTIRRNTYLIAGATARYQIKGWGVQVIWAPISWLIQPSLGTRNVEVVPMLLSANHLLCDLNPKRVEMRLFGTELDSSATVVF